MTRDWSSRTAPVADFVSIVRRRTRSRSSAPRYETVPAYSIGKVRWHQPVKKDGAGKPISVPGGPRAHDALPAATRGGYRSCGEESWHSWRHRRGLRCVMEMTTTDRPMKDADPRRPIPRPRDLRAELAEAWTRAETAVPLKIAQRCHLPPWTAADQALRLGCHAGHCSTAANPTVPTNWGAGFHGDETIGQA